MRKLDLYTEVSSTESSLKEDVGSPRESNTASEAKIQQESGSRRRGLLALSMPLALAGLLSACGKVVFGGTTTTVKRVPKAGANGTPDGPGDGADSEVKNTGDDGGTYGSGDDAASTSDAAVPPCDPAGLGNLDLAKIAVDTTLIEPSVAEGVKIWGRQSSALIALSLKKSIEQGSTIILSVASIDGPAIGRVLATRQIMNAAVDISTPTSLVWFDNINLSGITKLTLVLVPVNGSPSKIDIENKATEFHPQSKRFATKFKSLPVIDVQLGALPDAEGLANDLPNFGATSPIFGGEANGFGFSRDTTSAFRAVNIRTAGYPTDSSAAETAHVAHALTSWQFPAKFKQSGTIVTDLLERDISSSFASAATTALRDDYTFVVYVPDNGTSPTRYFRTIISVG